MKTCPYCGKEYPDDAGVCVLDQSPLTPAKPKPAAEPAIESSPTPAARPPMTAGYFFYAAIFAVLSGICGVGLTWLIVAISANFMPRNRGDAFIASSGSALLAGGIIAFVAGLIGFVFVVKPDPQSEAAAARKYVGPGGRLRIYSGAPLFFIVMLIPFFDRLEHVVSTKVAVYIALGIVLVIVAVSLALYDRIPAKLIIPVGIAGWLMILALGIGLIFFGPGLFGHR